MLKSMWSTEGDLKMLPTMIFIFDLNKSGFQFIAFINDQVRTKFI